MNDDEMNDEELEALEDSQEEFTPEEIAEEMEEQVEAVARDKKHSIFWKLYHGETNFGFVRHQRRWYLASAAFILAGAIALAINGLNFGIDFDGGSSWRVPAAGLTEEQINEAVSPIAGAPPTVQFATARSSASGKDERVAVVRVKTSSTEETAEVTDALAKLADVPQDKLDAQSVSSSWGSQITDKAIRALIVFFIVITLYISWRFEPKMAFATLVALLHDLLITIGVYAIFKFEVTPATVIAVLTIQGFSIYDGIVVFDRVDENARGLAVNGKMTYSDMVDLSLNQVLMRSINTSITAILPVGSLLVIGSLVLGVNALEEFALALFIGLLAGAYSSIFIASPVLAWLKEKEPRYANIRNRLGSRQSALLTPAMAAASSSTSSAEKTAAKPKPKQASKQTAPRPRKKKKRR